MNVAFANRQKELDLAEKDLNKTKSDIDVAKTNADELFKRAKIQQEESIKQAIALQKEKDSHYEKINTHCLNMQADKETIAAQKASTLEIEKKAQEKMLLAENKLQESLGKECEIEKKADYLAHIQGNVNDDIKSNKEILDKNIAILEDIKKERESVKSIQNDILAEKIDLANTLKAIQEGSNVLDKKKTEISDSLYDLKNASIKNELNLKNIQSKSQDLDYKIGKLNELKNNIESLMKLQEKEK